MQPRANNEGERCSCTEVVRVNSNNLSAHSIITQNRRRKGTKKLGMTMRNASELANTFPSFPSLPFPSPNPKNPHYHCRSVGTFTNRQSNVLCLPKARELLGFYRHLHCITSIERHHMKLADKVPHPPVSLSLAYVLRYVQGRAAKSHEVACDRRIRSRIDK